MASQATSFPIFENAARPDISPEDGYDLVENAKILFDDYSVMYVHGVGAYEGASTIGNLLHYHIPERQIYII